MIHHVSISAEDTHHVANVLAKPLDGGQGFWCVRMLDRLKGGPVK